MKKIIILPKILSALIFFFQYKNFALYAADFKNSTKHTRKYIFVA